jgi:branched-chain amino acid aminotransferase
VTSVDRIVVGGGERGPVTKAIQDAFFGIVNGELPDRYGWLSHVPVGAAARS